MRKQKTSIEIPKPCTESWAGMTPDTNGRFCGSCQKTVIDFTQLSDKAILDYFKNNTGNSCGRFYNAQLNRELIEPKEPKKFSIYKWMLSLFLFINTNKINAQSEVTPVSCDTIVKPSPRIMLGMVRPPQHKDSLNNYISGIVRDETGMPLVGTAIIISGTKTGVGTDTSGKFKLQIPDPLLNKNLELTVSYIGYETQTININTKSSFPIQNITMQLVKLEMGDVVIVGGAFSRKKKKHWWWPFGKRR